MSTMAAAIGASIHIYTDLLQAGFLSAIGGLIFFILLMTTSDNGGKDMHWRFGYLMGFTSLTGIYAIPIFYSPKES